VDWRVWCGVGCLSLLGCAPLPQQVAGAGLGEMPSASTAGWQSFTLPGKRKTRYEAAWRDGQPAIRAVADRSASMWRRSMRLAPSELGRVSFSWWVPQLIDTADLGDADTADAPVRVVLAFEGDRTKLTLRERLQFDLAQSLTGEQPPYATLMYVWDTKAAPGTVIPGNRSSRIRKLVLDSGPQQLQRWRQHSRSIAEDFRLAFGEEPGPLVGVALMTDSDNTQSRVRAYYGDIVFTQADGRVLKPLTLNPM
jgi:hypothetical protein